MEKLILILEDSPSCQLLARESLRQVGSIHVVASCKEARELMSQNDYNVILIDMTLTDGNGFEFYGELLRKNPNFKIPVIFATADEDITKKVAAFSVGASDYVTKPYAPLELRARVERILRLSEPPSLYHDEKSGLTLDLRSYQVSKSAQGKMEKLPLTPNEFKILQLLMKFPERIYSRNQIIDSVWGQDTFITERTVDTHISSLRKKLKELSSCIISVRGEGYIWKQASQILDMNLRKSSQGS